MKTKTFIPSIFGALAGTALLAGCSDVETLPAAGEGSAAVNFTAAIESARPAAGASATRTVVGDDGQSEWSEGDRAGLFMLGSGGSIPGGISGGAYNIPYEVDPATGVLRPADAGLALYYPKNQAVDFVAYSPYTKYADEQDRIDHYMIYQTTDAQQAASDFLYSDNVRGVLGSENPVELRFRHVLTKLRFDVTLGGGLEDGSVWEFFLTDMPGHIYFNLRDGSVAPVDDVRGNIYPLQLEQPAPDADVSFTVLVVPGEITGGVKVKVGGNYYTGTISRKGVHKANTLYVYPVTVQKTGVEIGSSNVGDWTPVYRGTGEATLRSGIETVRIPAGRFRMGSSDGSNIGDKDGSGLNTEPAEPNRVNDEVQHWVTLTRDFSMSCYEITNEQYAEFLNAVGVLANGRFTLDTYPDGLHPKVELVRDSKLTPHDAYGVTFENDRWIPMPGFDKYPVCNVTWYGANEYAHWVGGALPTEAQWEYACRAGSQTPFFFGSNIDALHEYAWCSEYIIPNVYFRPNPVGQKLPNPHGLYDMYGNVWEWCWDNYGDYGSEEVTDPTGPATSQYRVTRGCATYNEPRYFRSAFRCLERAHPTKVEYGIGFRVVFNH